MNNRVVQVLMLYRLALIWTVQMLRSRWQPRVESEPWMKEPGRAGQSRLVDVTQLGIFWVRRKRGPKPKEHLLWGPPSLSSSKQGIDSPASPHLSRLWLLSGPHIPTTPSHSYTWVPCLPHQPLIVGMSMDLDRPFCWDIPSMSHIWNIMTFGGP